MSVGTNCGTHLTKGIIQLKKLYAVEGQNVPKLSKRWIYSECGMAA